MAGAGWQLSYGLQQLNLANLVTILSAHFPEHKLLWMDLLVNNAI